MQYGLVQQGPDPVCDSICGGRIHESPATRPSHLPTGSGPLSRSSNSMGPRETRSGYSTPLQMTPVTPSTTPLNALVEAVAGKGAKSITEANPASLAVAAKLNQFGIGIGPGVNPSVVAGAADGGSGSSGSNNPPIVNTGNSGPMCVQPGDWICGTCGFVNWRRRKVCMRCYPFAEGNELASNLQHGAILAAQLAAGLDPTSEQGVASFEALMNSRPRRISLPKSRQESATGAATSHHSKALTNPVSPDLRFDQARIDGGRAGSKVSVSHHRSQGPRFAEHGLEECLSKTLRLGTVTSEVSGQLRGWDLRPLGRPTTSTRTYSEHSHPHTSPPASNVDESPPHTLSREIWSTSPSRPVVMRPDDREDRKLNQSKPEPIGTKYSTSKQDRSGSEPHLQSPTEQGAASQLSSHTDSRV
ncbi:hypothetical protein ACQY0O_001239 [Thecaphora frezii]